MKLPTFKKINLKGKRVLLRVGFDVPLKNGKVTETFRIERTLPTIRFLRNRGAKIIILSHLGKGGASQKPVAAYLRRYFKVVKFIPRLFGDSAEKEISKMKNGDMLMLENLRTDKGEEKNDTTFTKKLAVLGDIYVNDAFSVSHRSHASIVGLPEYLPSYVGLLFESEVKNLTAAFKAEHPFLLILGGVKFESKLGVLERFIKIADKIFIGGALANNFLKLKGTDIGKSVFDGKVSVKKYINNPKIVLPVDLKKKEGLILDIGPETLKKLCVLIKKAKFILWNGPMGNFEAKGFSEGTEKTAKCIASSRSFSIVGGGDSVAAANWAGVIKKFSFVSTGGGAMLEFLAKGTLPGIEVLQKSKNKT